MPDFHAFSSRVLYPADQTSVDTGSPLVVDRLRHLYKLLVLSRIQLQELDTACLGLLDFSMLLFEEGCTRLGAFFPVTIYPKPGFALSMQRPRTV